MRVMLLQSRCNPRLRVVFAGDITLRCHPCLQRGSEHRAMPEQCFPAVLPPCRDWRVLVVDDGSTDDTAEQAQATVQHWMPMPAV